MENSESHEFGFAYQNEWFINFMILMEVYFEETTNSQSDLYSIIIMRIILESNFIQKYIYFMKSCSIKCLNHALCF